MPHLGHAHKKDIRDAYALQLSHRSTFGCFYHPSCRHFQPKRSTLLSFGFANLAAAASIALRTTPNQQKRITQRPSVALHSHSSGICSFSFRRSTLSKLDIRAGAFSSMFSCTEMLLQMSLPYTSFTPIF